MSPNIEVACDL